MSDPPTPDPRELPGARTGGDYRPIDCSLHDRLEAVATLGRTVELTLRTDEGGRKTVRDRVVDLFARDGVEYLRTAAGEVIRLDRLEGVSEAG